VPETFSLVLSDPLTVAANDHLAVVVDASGTSDSCQINHSSAMPYPDGAAWVYEAASGWSVREQQDYPFKLLMRH
jgi:hypothetical protein